MSRPIDCYCEEIDASERPCMGCERAGVAQRSAAEDALGAVQTLVECKGDCRAYDCHAGPGTTEPGCGACITCLHRVLQGVEAERDQAKEDARLLRQRVEQLERERQETAALVAALEARTKVMAGRRRRRLPFSRFATQVVCEEPDCTRFADPPQGGGRALCDDHRRAAALPLAAAQCREEA